ncbi:aminotransferase class I/II-fold pyridoxal phosphate-dependent enzyme [Patescibacteria group bacterium]
MSPENVDPWLDPEYRPDGSRNEMHEMDYDLQQMAVRGPELRTSEDPPLGMPAIKAAAQDILKEMEEGAELDIKHTQGDRGEITNQGGQPVRATQLEHEAGMIEEDLRYSQSLDRAYIGKKLNDRIEESMKRHLLLPDNVPLSFAIGNSGRDLFRTMHQKCLDRNFIITSQAIGRPGIDWPGYDVPALKPTSGDRYKTDRVIYSTVNPELGFATASELEEAIQFASNNNIDMKYFAVSTPGNPGLAIPHDNLKEMIKVAAQYGVILWVDNFYGALGPEPTLNVELLRRELSPDELGHALFIDGTTKWYSSNERLAWATAVGDHGPAVDIVRLTEQHNAPTAATRPIGTLSVMLAYLESEKGSFEAMGELGAEVRRKIGKLGDVLRESGVPFMMSGVSYYAFINLMQFLESDAGLSRPLTVTERMRIMEFGYAPGESFMTHSGRENFARLSAAVPDESIEMLNEKLNR